MRAIHSAIPIEELFTFASMKKVKVVFDVGAREDVDYLILKPGIELHAFEPDPEFFEQLKKNVGDTPNVYLNNYGLGDVEGKFHHHKESQALTIPDSEGLLVRRLDDYVAEHEIKKIDFLKIDVEGFELKVLKGGRKTIPKCRYIQYERCGEAGIIDGVLKEHGFYLFYMGFSNTLAVRKGEEKPWTPPYPKEDILLPKDENRYLRKYDD